MLYFFFKGKYEWTLGGPVGFQQYKHFYYQRKLLQYRCYKYYEHEKIGNLCPNLTSVKSSAKHMLHSHSKPVVHMKNCTLMLLSNLREPDWISVSCNKNLVNTIICKQKHRSENSNIVDINEKSEFYFCKSNTIVINDKCYSFLWGKIGNSSGQFCLDKKAKGVFFKLHTDFCHIFNAVSSVNTFPTVIFQNNISVKFHKLFGKVRFIYHIENNSTVSGTHICVSHKRRNYIGTNIFHCIKGGYILYRNTCDGVNDCPNDSSDEQSCICKKSFSLKQ